MGSLFLHGLESNPGSSLQTEEEAGPRDSQESSPTPQFKSINSALSFLHSPYRQKGEGTVNMRLRAGGLSQGGFSLGDGRGASGG